MWAIRSRSHLLKISSCPIQLLRCQRQLNSGTVNYNHTEHVEMKKDIPNTYISSNTSTATDNNNNNNNNGNDNDNYQANALASLFNAKEINDLPDLDPKIKQLAIDAISKNESKDANNMNDKPKSRSRKHRLLRTLQHRVAKHKNKTSVIIPFHTGSQHGVKTKVVTGNEIKEDLDDTWTDLDPILKYERIYPKMVTPVATLAHGLDRTLFKSGVHLLKDFKRNRHYFTPFLENITQPDDFDYDAFQPYRTASKDKDLIGMAKEQNAQYVGSTSSLSGILSQLYFNVSNHRPVDTSCLSKGFADLPNNHTRGSRLPKTILLRWKDGVYAVDADKTFDTGDTILSHLGKSMEKVLTMKPNEYERYLKKNSSTLTEEERNAPEAFAYGRMGDVLLRSQLDCYHRKLPRRTFDLKTRATMPIRLDIPHYQDYFDYQLVQNHGIHYSFEREYYDMMRSAFLKYSFQVRIGHMDGIMVTYHNTDKIFGFQYISRSEMDSRLFGTSKMGDEVFNHCLNLMQTIFRKATTQYPKQTLRMTFDASLATSDHMRIYIEPISEEQEKHMDDMDNNADTTTSTNMATFADATIDNPMFAPVGDQLTMYRLYTTSYLNGKKIIGPVSVNKELDTWDVCYKLEEEQSTPNISTFFKRVRFRQATVFLPQSDESPNFLKVFKSKGHFHSQKGIGGNDDNDNDDNDHDNDDDDDKQKNDNDENHPNDSDMKNMTLDFLLKAKARQEQEGLNSTSSTSGQ